MPSPAYIPAVAAVLFATLSMAPARPIAVNPVRAEGFAESLNGEWFFRYVAGQDDGGGFEKPDFDASAWKKIPVPGNWEMHGFAEPKYSWDLAKGTGLYRRTFRTPAGWSAGRRVCLRFEGVANGFEAWVNGRKVGAAAASAYNPTTLDVTAELLPGVDNVLAVKVLSKPENSGSDVFDDWSFCGIFRDVTLFSVPETYARDLTVRTTLAADGAAMVAVSVEMSRPDCEIRGKLLAPDGSAAGDFPLPRQPDGRFAATLRVARPALWTAETPALYRLILNTSNAAGPLQEIALRVGLREIEIVDGVLRLNGRPIKLRGVNRHDESPAAGRAVTEQDFQRDLALIRRGNVNFVRTSHYPPAPRFLELCDEMGIYVMCEVPFSGFRAGEKSSPAYRANLAARVDATIGRDKNHASVIAWSIGNENRISPELFEISRRAKALDPTRPVCHPTVGQQFDANPGRFPDFVDILAPHYPTREMLARWVKSLKRPVILTEFAHANGLAMDRLQDQWETIQASPHFAGGAVWHLMDQGILRKSPTPPDRGRPTPYAWPDKDHFYDTHGLDGQDGVVYADRTPQSDFWEMRKVYAPVRIAESAVAVGPGAREIALTVANRYDFRSLAGLTLAWALERNGGAIQSGKSPLAAASHTSETVEIPVNVPAGDDVLVLRLRCFDEHGNPITEHAVRLDIPAAGLAAWSKSLPAEPAPEVRETDAGVEIETTGWTLTADRRTGAIAIRDPAGKPLVIGIFPHCGRGFIGPELNRARKSGSWAGSVLAENTAPEIAVTHAGEAVRLKVGGNWPRKGKPAQSFAGFYELEIGANGAIAIRYDFVPTDATGILLEAGLSLEIPAEMRDFRWIGQGLYPAYPGKDLLDEFGLFHLDRDDLHFQGNRRATEIALLTTARGAGVALGSQPTDIAVERAGKSTYLSHNAVISSLGNKGFPAETAVDAASAGHIAGSFTLVPLGSAWPAALVRWFGQPAPAKEVFQPFYHSYDQ